MLDWYDYLLNGFDQAPNTKPSKYFPYSLTMRLNYWEELTAMKKRLDRQEAALRAISAKIGFDVRPYLGESGEWTSDLTSVPRRS